MFPFKYSGWIIITQLPIFLVGLYFYLTFRSHISYFSHITPFLQTVYVISSCHKKIPSIPDSYKSKYWFIIKFYFMLTFHIWISSISQRIFQTTKTEFSVTVLIWFTSGALFVYPILFQCLKLPIVTGAGPSIYILLLKIPNSIMVI